MRHVDPNQTKNKKHATKGLRALPTIGSTGTGGGFAPNTGTIGARCQDHDTTWFDSSLPPPGVEFNCDYFNNDSSRCEVFGNMGQPGESPNEACCICGGGGTGNTDSGEARPLTIGGYQETACAPPDPNCQDCPATWVDSFGGMFDCGWYTLDCNRCPVYAGNSATIGTRPADVSCCACGGGCN